MSWLHAIFPSFLLVFVRLAALFNTKLARAIDVRKGWDSELENWKSNLRDSRPVLCFHCASLGEYEMIVPLLNDEAIQKKYQCVLTFFSPSGYDYVKSSDKIAAKFYLPFDTQANMKRFVSLLNPSVFVFVKYDFWYNLLNQLHRSQVKTVVVNGLFRPKQFLFRLAAKPLLNQIKKCDRIFVQNAASSELLNAHGFTQVEVTNDLRFDRVAEIKNKAMELPKLKAFTEDQLTIIAGSSWPEEEALLKAYLDKYENTTKLIIAPHDVSETHINTLVEQFAGNGVCLYTDEPLDNSCNVLILNTIGQLSSAYQYADLAVIGGAFGKGLHNVLEAVNYELPVITGPNIGQFPEAIMLKKTGVLFPVSNADEFIHEAYEIMQHESLRRKIGITAKNWMQKHTGASASIVKYLLNVAS
jgi:3-deoxy-D-manno-octulosonic-acid transferase